MNALNIEENVPEVYSKRSIVLSFLVHGLLLFVHMDVLAPKKAEEKPKVKEAIKVTFVSAKPTPKPVKKEEYKKTEVSEPVVQQSPIKVQEEIKTPPQKAEIGTQKVVPNSKALGNPNQKVEQVVQKGDPMSQKREKYKPGTELRKTKAANIGTGSSSPNKVTKNGGGGSGAHRVKVGNNYGNGRGDGGSGNGSGGGIGDGFGGGSGDGTITGSTQGTLNPTKIATNIGSFTGATVGKIDSSKGYTGLAHKGRILLAGEPLKTVVVGSIDPEVVRNILREHMPQFRYCYQKELDKNVEAKDFQGIMNFNFTIVGTGQVGRVNITSKDNLPGAIRDCVTDVVSGIQFPSPKGGGTVEVNQPINFYPKK